jgi:hypothetical protein
VRKKGRRNAKRVEEREQITFMATAELETPAINLFICGSFPSLCFFPLF